MSSQKCSSAENVCSPCPNVRDTRNILEDTNINHLVELQRPKFEKYSIFPYDFTCAHLRKEQLSYLKYLQFIKKSQYLTKYFEMRKKRMINVQVQYQEKQKHKKFQEVEMKLKQKSLMVDDEQTDSNISKN